MKGKCDIACLTDLKYDIEEHATITIRRSIQRCEENIGFACIPIPEMVLEEVLKLFVI